MRVQQFALHARMSLLCSVFVLGGMTIAESVDDIVPYKFEKTPPKNFVIPSSVRHTAPRFAHHEPNLIYYFTKPKKESSYPIAIACEGSSNRFDIGTVFHFHRYYLQEFMDLGLGVVTLEQWGVDGKNTDRDVFIEHYTRSRRLSDHQALVEHLLEHPPKGWNGKLVFFGISEGGPLVLRLAEDYSHYAVATINWSGAGNWSWRDEVWAFIEHHWMSLSWWQGMIYNIFQYIPFIGSLPNSRQEYDCLMDEIQSNPHELKEFLGMTYRYHADALTCPLPNYSKMKTPLLVVAGGLDPAIDSFDDFARQVQEKGCPCTYLRVDDMDHYVMNRPEVEEASFEWLRQHLK